MGNKASLSHIMLPSAHPSIEIGIHTHSPTRTGSTAMYSNHALCNHVELHILEKIKFRVVSPNIHKLINKCMKNEGGKYYLQSSIIVHLCWVEGREGEEWRGMAWGRSLSPSGLPLGCHFAQLFSSDRWRQS